MLSSCSDSTSFNSYTSALQLDCDKCEEGVETIPDTICRDCLLYLCLSHVSSHRQDRFTSNHRLVSKDEVVEFEGVQQLVTEYREVCQHTVPCALHTPQAADMFCVECRIVVCSLCSILKDHHQHRFISLHRKNNETIEIQGDGIKELSDCQDEVRIFLGSLSLNRAREVNSIQERFELLKSRITEDFSMQLRKLNDLFDERQSFLSSHALVIDSIVTFLHLEKVGNASHDLDSVVRIYKSMDVITLNDDVSIKWHELDILDYFLFDTSIPELCYEIKIQKDNFIIMASFPSAFFSSIASLKLPNLVGFSWNCPQSCGTSKNKKSDFSLCWSDGVAQLGILKCAQCYQSLQHLDVYDCGMNILATYDS